MFYAKRRVFLFLTILVLLSACPAFAKNSEEAADSYSSDSEFENKLVTWGSANGDSKIAEEYAVKSVEKITEFFAVVMQTGGIVLIAYAVGKLVMSFVNDDGMSKMTAAALLGTGLVLAVLPQIIKGLDITQYM